MEEKKAGLDSETIRALVRLVDDNTLTELTVEGEEYAVTLKAEGVVQGVAPLSLALAPTGAAADAVQGIDVPAPMTGVFYRSPAPGEPAFVEIGDAVEVGQVIGLIEAMKVFSEVPSEVAGRVIAVPAKNGELVQQGQALIVLAEEGSENAS